MTKQATLAAAWLLETHRAALHTSLLEARCDLQSLDRGFNALHIAGNSCEGALWQVTSPQNVGRTNPLIETYIRDNDLVASYAATSDFPFATQLYWRLLQADETLSVSTIVSVQTDLLDTHPVIELSCELPADEVSLLATDKLDDAPTAAQLPTTLPEFYLPQLVLFRLKNTNITYAEAIDPSDFCGLSLTRTSAGHVRCTWRLFLHFLEKGVIRRSRLWSALVPRDNDAVHAAASFRDFLASELPLTA